MEKLSPSVQSCVNYIIVNERFSILPKVEVSEGAKVGDGFCSKTFAINIKGTEKNISLFVKYLPEGNIKRLLNMYRGMFYQEMKFYEEIFPAMLEFQKKRGVQEIFDNVPKYYHIVKYSKEEFTPPIILENLKYLGYKMREFDEVIDEAHINLVFKTYAKLHAVSYAMKDQQPELFEKLALGIEDLLCEAFTAAGISNHVVACVQRFLECLNPILDKHILDKCVHLARDLVELSSTVTDYVDKYSVICQGDSWSNNMMFLYNETSGLPDDIKLVDFQEQKYNSPVLDLVYFFYTVATKYSLERFDSYCDLYYNALTSYIAKLGTDPNKMYSRTIFNQHWKKFAKFGLAMAFFVLREQFQPIEKITNVLESDSGMLPIPSGDFCGEDLYNTRMKMLVEHFIERDFL